MDPPYICGVMLNSTTNVCILTTHLLYTYLELCTSSIASINFKELVDYGSNLYLHVLIGGSYSSLCGQSEWTHQHSRDSSD